MINIYETIKKYTDGTKTLEETNKALKFAGLYLDPEKNVIKNGEAAIAYKDISKITGYAMLDSGTGSLDKVAVKQGKLVDSVGSMKAFVIIGSTRFAVAEDGVTLCK